MAFVMLALVLFTASIFYPVRWTGSAKTFQQLMDGWSSQARVPGVLLRVNINNETVFSSASGSTQRWGQGRPLRAEDRFHMASIGKLFTAVAALRLCERGLLDLDARVAELLGPEIVKGLVVMDGKDQGAKITVRHLLNHTAGFGNTDDNFGIQLGIMFKPDERRTPLTLIDQARRVPPVGFPGHQQHYSSAGYFLLGLVLEKVSSLPYHEVVRREILVPLNLSSTHESTHEWKRSDEELHHYVGLVELWKVDPSFEYADGGFVTTTDDLARFGQALMSGAVFEQPQTLSIMTNLPITKKPLNPSSQFGLGIGVEKDPQGDKMFYHLGFFGCGLVMVPSTQTVIVYALGQSAADIELFQKQVLELSRPQIR